MKTILRSGSLVGLVAGLFGLHAAPSAAQPAVQEAIDARLLVSTFLNACRDTGADPDRMEDLARSTGWNVGLPQYIANGLNRPAKAGSVVYSYDRRRRDKAGNRVSSPVYIILPEAAGGDCTFQFSDISYDLVTYALERSGFTAPAAPMPEDPTLSRRSEWTTLCEQKVRYRRQACVEVSVDSSLYPPTGQLTARGRPTPPNAGTPDEG